MRLLDGFFRSPSVEPLFSDTATVQAILDFEAALARAQAQAGIIPASTQAAIVAQCRAELFDLEALAQAMPSAGNLAIPLLKQLNALVGKSSPEAARYIHFGATSQDALDTALVLQLRAATRELLSDIEAIIAALAKLSSDHRATLLVARTWLQHALPTTFGYVTAGWLDAMLQHRARLQWLLANALVLQFGGAAGTLAALGSRGLSVTQHLAAELRLPQPRLPWHSSRERMGEVASALALLCGTLAKVARDLSLYMQTEVAELSEPPAAGRGGSSTMPHKQNPVATAAILASALRVPALASSVLSGMHGEFQRSVGRWQAEWELLPEIASLTAGAACQLAVLLPGIAVHKERMRANLELTNGLIYAEAISLALSEKLNRASAHKLVEAACRRAQSEGTHLREILSSDREVSSILDAAALKSLFEPANYLGSADVFIDSVLSAVEVHAPLPSPEKP